MDHSQCKIFLSSGTAQTNGGGSLVIATYSFASYKVLAWYFISLKLPTRLEAVLEAMSDYTWVQAEYGTPHSPLRRILMCAYDLQFLVEQLQHRSKYIGWQKYWRRAVFSEHIILFDGTSYD
jgi:hypothetical protein